MEKLIEIFEPFDRIFGNTYVQIGIIALVAFSMWREWNKSPWRILEKFYKNSYLNVSDNFIQTTLFYENKSFLSRGSTVLVWNVKNSLYVRIPWPICYIQPCLLIPWDDITVIEKEKLFVKSYLINMKKVPKIGLRFGRKFKKILGER